MQVQDFIAKWQANTRTERAAAQEHFLDLCAVLGEPTPNSDPTGADYAVEALPASPEEAGLLDLPAGVPLLVATQRTRDQHGVVFELGRTAYRGDRFRFRATLGAPPPPPPPAPGPS